MNENPRSLTEQVIFQIDWHWSGQLRPRLTGLTDDEYFWEPSPGAWNVHPRGRSNTSTGHGAGKYTIDWEYPEPKPAPMTTIAWRMGHIIVGILGARVAGHFGGPPIDYESFQYAGSADEALRQLDQQYAAWLAGVRTWDEAALAEPSGPAEGPWHEYSRAVLTLHINRELIHHGAEIALLRDLYAHRDD
ncbi:DinB family protein [Cumulibacter soli]|uniref:DinB family protein n=1 Tax=Cumulibacter soli TaxID=2546344 RepID=UPI001068C009|nr:DinB family protein [Cumulibacter soli]